MPWNKRLLHKLDSLSISGNMFGFLRSFVWTRTSQVRLHQTFSNVFTGKWHTANTVHVVLPFLIVRFMVLVLVWPRSYCSSLRMTLIIPLKLSIEKDFEDRTNYRSSNTGGNRIAVRSTPCHVGSYEFPYHHPFTEEPSTASSHISLLLVVSGIHLF